MCSRNWGLGGLIFVIIILEILYGITGYQSEKQVIGQNREEIKRTQEKIDDLEEQTEKISDIKNELVCTKRQKQAFMNRIPDYRAYSKQIAEFLRYLECHEFSNISCQMIENEEMPQSIENILMQQYELRFVGKYNEIVNWIDHLNASNQVMHIRQIVMTNEVQDLEKEENKQYWIRYREEMDKVIQVSMQITLYIKAEGKRDQEIYHPDFGLDQNTDSLFKWIKPNGSEQIAGWQQEQMDDNLEDEADNESGSYTKE